MATEIIVCGSGFKVTVDTLEGHQPRMRGVKGKTRVIGDLDSFIAGDNPEKLIGECHRCDLVKNRRCDLDATASNQFPSLLSPVTQ